MSNITLRESMILRFDQKMTNTGVLSAMCDNLCKEGIVKDSYKAAILEREASYPTGLNCGGINIAIPHADIVHVNEAAISVAILKEPASFKAMDEPDGDVPISIVIMLALTEAHGHIEMLQKIVGLIQNQAELQKMIDSDDNKAVMELMEKELLN